MLTWGFQSCVAPKLKTSIHNFNQFPFSVAKNVAIWAQIRQKLVKVGRLKTHVLLFVELFDEIRPYATQCEHFKLHLLACLPNLENLSHVLSKQFLRYWAPE